MLDVLSGCVALHTLTLSYLKSLTSVDVLSGCAALRSLEINDEILISTYNPSSPMNPMKELQSLPDLSALSSLEVKGSFKLLEPWEQGGRKRYPPLEVTPASSA